MAQLSKNKKRLRIIPLGGICEIGKNLTVFETDNDMILVDCGVAFPEDDMPGIDAIIPDFTYIMQNKDKLRAIILTHGHEDHIGALPYFLKELNVPIYGTKLTLALVEKKLEDFNLAASADLQVVKHSEMIMKGDFCIEFIRTNHSIADACALAIITPCGIVIHTGDFKVDYTPIDGAPIDLMRFAELGEKGVLLLMADSTNAERRGFTMSERTVGATFDDIFSRTKGRLIVATFSSNIHRVQQIIDTAAKFNRKCVICGRSMVNIASAASRIGELRYSDDVVVDIDKIKNIDDRNLVIISTGSQGEPMSALTRMASDDLSKVRLGYNDTVILSASPIPGNERMVYNVINNLYRHGCRVIYESLAEVHVSGHAYQEELKLMHSLLKPKFFMPVHGEHRHQKKHAELAMKMGETSANIIVPDIGNQVLVTKRAIKLTDIVPAGAVLVDGLGVGDVGSTVLRDRKHLAEEGLFVVVIALDSAEGKINGVDVISRGFVYADDAEDLMEEAKKLVFRISEKVDLKELEDLTVYKNLIRKEVKAFLYKETRRSPMILPIVAEN